jgi:hypothetical protein
MGLTSVMMEVGNPARPEKTEELEFLVDSGATYSVVPARVLRRLESGRWPQKNSDSPTGA